MQKWIGWVNVGLAAMIGLLLLAAAFFWVIRPSHFEVLDEALPQTGLPSHPFTLTKENYDAIDSPFLETSFKPLSLQLPDLRRYLLYYGKNGRPDANMENSFMHFAFTGNKTPFSVKTGEKIYLFYDRSLTPSQYILSPGNQESSLWFQVQTIGNQVQVSVSMRDENGQIIETPPDHHRFVVQEKEFAKHGGPAWELNGQKVDGTLLARQKARWYGTDKFMERHGGEEYASLQGKQRIDFGDGENLYSAYVSIGDTLAWSDGRWRAVQPGKDSLGKPLLILKRVDERLINFELWDPEGNGKLILNLIKSNESWQPQNIQQQFKFVGARTRSQFIFELNKDRLLLSPHDWLLMTPEGWIKLTTPEDIDGYVERKTIGPLFVFDGIVRKEDRQVLTGTIFNTSRSDMFTVELPVQQAAAPEGEGKAADKQTDDSEDDAEEDDSEE